MKIFITRIPRTCKDIGIKLYMQHAIFTIESKGIKDFELENVVFIYFIVKGFYGRTFYPGHLNLWYALQPPFRFYKIAADFYKRQSCPLVKCDKWYWLAGWGLIWLCFWAKFTPLLLFWLFVSKLSIKTKQGVNLSA